MELCGWLLVLSGILSPGASRTGRINNTAMVFGADSSSVIGSSLTHLCTVKRKKDLGTTVDCAQTPSTKQKLSNDSLVTVTRQLWISPGDEVVYMRALGVPFYSRCCDDLLFVLRPKTKIFVGRSIFNLLG